jgi:hypothetical protein
MIVRILHEGQFRIKGADLDRINDVDNELVEAVAEGDEARVRPLLHKLLEVVRECGHPVPIDEFIESDVILPAPDSDLEELQEMFSGEGLVPG